jgi:hypothetical protein
MTVGMAAVAHYTSNRVKGCLQQKTSLMLPSTTSFYPRGDEGDALFPKRLRRMEARELLTGQELPAGAVTHVTLLLR